MNNPFFMIQWGSLYTAFDCIKNGLFIKRSEFLKMLKFRRPSLMQFYFLAGHLPINKNYFFLIFYRIFLDLPDNFVLMSPSKQGKNEFCEKFSFLFAKNTV
jgi:hypothetical protein